jgi:hypothetical protein
MSFEGFEEMRGSRLSVLLLWQYFIWRGYYTIMTYLGEFSTVKHHLMLDSNLFICHLKDPRGSHIIVVIIQYQCIVCALTSMKAVAWA